MRQASKYNARMCIILGEDELNSRTALLKDMDGGDQQPYPLDELIDELITVLRRKLETGGKE